MNINAEIKHYRKTQEIKMNIVGHEYDDEGRILSPILEYATITEGEVTIKIFYFNPN